MTRFEYYNTDGKASFPTTLKSQQKYATNQGLSVITSTKPAWFRVTKATYFINRAML
jgi:hypothetical protein